MEKAALVLQGGGLRGVFTAGVLDVFLEHGIEFEYVIGTSAGALNGTNYVSKQFGRSFKILYEYRNDRQFGSLYNLIKNHNYFNNEYLFEYIAKIREPFDFKTFELSPVKFYCVSTSLKDASAQYFSKERKDFWNCLSASMSLPLISSPVEIDGELYLDGGNSEPIPFSKPLRDGYKKIVVIETKEKEYRKKPKSRAIISIYTRLYSKYPRYLNCLIDYANLYNIKVQEICDLEEKGEIFVIRPPQKVEVSRTEKSKRKLLDLYQSGRQTALSSLESLKGYLNGKN